MATFTTTTDRFPYNTTVTVYPQSNWPTAGLPPSGAPVGSSTTSAVVSSASVLTFTGLTAGTRYFMTAEVGGSYRYVGFVAPANTGTVGHADGLVCLSDPGWIGSSATALTSGTRYFNRFTPDQSFTSSGFRFRVITQSGTNDPCEIVVYSSAATFLASSGEVTGKLNAGNSTNQTVTLAHTFEAGQSYLIGIVATSTATLLTGSFGSSALTGLWGASAGEVPAQSKAAVGIGNTDALSGYSGATAVPILVALF